MSVSTHEGVEITLIWFSALYLRDPSTCAGDHFQAELSNIDRERILEVTIAVGSQVAAGRTPGSRNISR